MDTGMPHQMELKEVYADGSQDWHCPLCGRRFILHWPPNYHREVIIEGDIEAVHTAGTGGVQMGETHTEDAIEPEVSASVEPVDDLGFAGIPIELDDPTLSAFTKFFEEVDR